MKNVYYIGKFRFDSYSEYKKGLDDVKKIKYISDEVNINEPGVALRLYTLIRQKDIKFKSIIGEDYLFYLSDLVADDYKELSVSERYALEDTKENKIRKYIGIACIGIAIISFCVFIGMEYMDILKTRKMLKMKEEKNMAEVAQYIADTITQKEKVEETPAIIEENVATENDTIKNNDSNKKVIPRILPKYTMPPLSEYRDLVGWIQIDDTDINYPILQSKTEPNYYLDKDINGNKDINGSIFMDYRNNFLERDMNLIIYGHNMKSGMMFGKLKSYKDKDYYLSHKFINFDTLYSEEQYEIIAVCMGTVGYQDEDYVKYYNFTNPESQEDLNRYIDNINQMNIYDEPVNITMEDELLTVSTCDRFTEDGRLFLLAKKI